MEDDAKKPSPQPIPAAAKRPEPPKRELQAHELREREDGLEQALKLYASVSDRLAEALPLLDAAAADADRLRQMCEKSPVLRAAMVSRRLAVPAVAQDIRHLRFKTQTISSSVGKTGKSRRDELSEAVRDPELLR